MFTSTSTSIPPCTATVPAARVAELCCAAREYVERALGTPIDESEESLAFIDHYLNQVREAGDMEDEVLDLVAAALGAHLGELVIARFGGTWCALGEDEADRRDPANWRVDVACVPLRFDPVGMAAEAVRLGAVEGYDATFSTEPALMEQLSAALMRMAPVSDEYYYSLTGRFETLAYAVDLLGEFLHQQQEQEAPEADDQQDVRTN